jgi:hypothetical protein
VKSVSMPAAPLFALRLGVSLVMGFGALHALLARQSLVIASLELLGSARSGDARDA